MRYAALLAVVAIAGCQMPDASPPDAEASDAPAGISSAAATPSASAGTPTAEPPVKGGTLVLDADGLLLRAKGAEPRSVRYGALRPRAEALAREALGIEPVRTANAECGAGPMTFSAFGPLTLNFQDGRLVGWRAEEGGEAVTIDGIRPGVTRAELERERPVTMVEGSTLPGEFEYAAPDGTTLGGFLSGNGPEATVVSLHAGMTCFFR